MAGCERHLEHTELLLQPSMAVCAAFDLGVWAASKRQALALDWQLTDAFPAQCRMARPKAASEPTDH